MEKKKFAVWVYIRREGDSWANIAVEAESESDARKLVQDSIDKGTPALWKVLTEKAQCDWDDEAVAEEATELSEDSDPIDLDLSARHSASDQSV